MFIVRIEPEQRIQKELEYFKLNKDPSRPFDLAGNSMNDLTGKILGPAGTPYEGGKYQIRFLIPDNYPFSPPKVYFTTKIWHPNVSTVNGVVCMNILNNGWTTSTTLGIVMFSLRALMSAPETDKLRDAGFVASQYKGDREKFNKIAQYWAYKYAGGKSTNLNVASFDDLVKRVVAMGFSKDKAIKFLSQNSFDLQATVDKINKWRVPPKHQK